MNSDDTVIACTGISPPVGGGGVMQRLRLFAADIKISHTIFAMPFALLSTTLAWKKVGGPIIGKLGLILVCMIAARTVAMAANRVLDAALDKRNPRTAGRALPSGRLSIRFYLLAMGVCVAAFLAGCAGFWLWYANPWPLWASAPVLGFLMGYPLLKRFTQVCHYYLGVALGLAPIAAWVAVGGGWDISPLLMGVAVALWTAGFDIIYACQDIQSDRETGVFSVPARLGIGRALWLARISHVASVVLLLGLARHNPYLGWLFTLAVAATIILLAIEHLLVRADDLSKVGMAFFTVNGVISLTLGLAGIADALR